MTLTADALIDRDFSFVRHVGPWLVRTRVTVAAFDPARGWRLVSPSATDAWVPTPMLAELFEEGVLACA